MSRKGRDGSVCTLDFEDQNVMRSLERRYFEIVDAANLRSWTRNMVCMAGADHLLAIPGDLKKYETIFKDSTRYHPNWRDQGVKPEHFPSDAVQPAGPLSQCPRKYSSISRDYGLHHRRIERVAMAFHSLGNQFSYSQAFFPMIGLFYMAAVRCPEIGSHKAEVLAYTLMRRAITLDVSSPEKMPLFMQASLPMFEEIIPERYRARDRNLENEWISVVVTQRVAAGAGVNDVKYWTALWEFGHRMSIFAATTYAFAMKARLESPKAWAYYQIHHNYACVRAQQKEYTASELMAVLGEASDWFRRNINRFN